MILLSILWTLVGLVFLAQPTPAATAQAPQPPDVVLQDRCRAAADYSTRFSGRAVLVMLDGKVVFERYDRGWSADKPHPLASGTKSFSGVAAACAVQDGLLSWDEKVSDTIAEWKADPAKSRITIRHLLSLTSGLDADDPALQSRGLGQLGADLRPRRRDSDVQQADDKFKASLNTRMVGTPGGQFQYGPAHYYVFGELMNRKLAAAGRTEKTIDAYMKARIFDPIGLSFPALGWGRDRAGNPNLPGGARLTAREWAKFGELVRLQGQWVQPDGTSRRIVEWQHLSECFKPCPKNPAYGLTWWLLTGDPDAAGVADGAADEVLGGQDRPARRLRQANQAREVAGLTGPDGKPLTVYMAAGLGKQRLYVVPQHRLVVVRFAESTREGLGFDNAGFLGPILGLAAAEAGAEQPERAR